LNNAQGIKKNINQLINITQKESIHFSDIIYFWNFKIKKNGKLF